MKNKALIFCPLSNWYKYQTKKGKAKGKILEQRFVLGFDKFCWILGKEYKNGKFDQELFYGNMKTLLPNLKGYLGQHFNNDYCVNNIVRTLCNKFNMGFETKNYQTELPLGKELDDIFGTSFHIGYPPILYGKLTDETEITIL